MVLLIWLGGFSAVFWLTTKPLTIFGAYLCSVTLGYLQFRLREPKVESLTRQPKVLVKYAFSKAIGCGMVPFVAVWVIGTLLIAAFTSSFARSAVFMMCVLSVFAVQTLFRLAATSARLSNVK